MQNLRVLRQLVLLGVAGGFLLWPPEMARAETEVEQLQARLKQLESEAQAVRERIALLKAAPPAASSSPNPALKLTVLPGDWGNADAENISAVCSSAAHELLRFLPPGPQDPIALQYHAQQGPMVVFGRGNAGERRVLLNARDKYWSQFAYQFAHEFCHIQCRYRESNKANLWFEESLCETASLFVLRRMAETWKTNPPYPNWKPYAPSLHGYAEERLKNIEKLDGVSFAQWYANNAAELRKSGVNRAKNQVVAVALLPLLEKSPSHWAAVQYLNQWAAPDELSFSQYLRDWHQRVPAEQKAFVADVGKLFEISLP